MAQRIVIMAGGTGGHVFPALAVAQMLLDKGWQVSWLGTKAGIEARVVPEQGIEIDWLTISGFRGKGFKGKLLAPILLVRACVQALMILRRRKPQLVLGMGGFVAGPGGLMAKLLGIPLVIHEQNRIPGSTNRLLSKVAVAVLEAFPASFPAAVKAVCTGNPLRQDLVNIPAKEIWHAERPLNILIVGGSQGAQALNQMIPTVLTKLAGVNVLHQTGSVMLEEVQQHYATADIKPGARAFITDMREAYIWADMLICRAGAMTISEIAAAGLPAILVPLPHAIDDHQTANARLLVDAGAALMVLQKDLNEQNLLTAIKKIQENIVTMSANARNASRLDATTQVVEICIARART